MYKLPSVLLQRMIGIYMVEECNVRLDTVTAELLNIGRYM